MKKYKFKFAFTILSLLLLQNCNSQSKNESINSVIISRVETTKVYSVKSSFDQLVIDEPIYSLGYEDVLEIDTKWSIKHFDKFNNIVLIEDFMLDKENVDKYYIFRETAYQNTYDDNNILIESTESVKQGMYNNITKKTKFYYDKNGNCIKKEIYLEKGLVETVNIEYIDNNISYSVRYKYDLDNDFYDLKIESKYEWKNNQITSIQISHIRDNRVIGEYSKQFSYDKVNYSKVVTEEGYFIHKLFSSEKSYFKNTKSYNNKGNVTKYNDEIFVEPMLIEYNYNDGEWNKINISTPFNKHYIIVRDIKKN